MSAESEITRDCQQKRFPRMRTVNQVVSYAQENDAFTSVTQNFVRTCVKNGTVRSVKSGSKFLVNLDDFENFLASCSNGATPQA